MMQQQFFDDPVDPDQRKARCKYNTTYRSDKTELSNFEDCKKPRQKQAFLTNREPEEITEKKTFQKPTTACGRPNERISESQLNKAVQIVSWDMAKQGKVKQWSCPEHGKANRSFDVSPDGVRVWCETCGKTTHFELSNFQGCDEHGDE